MALWLPAHAGSRDIARLDFAGRWDSGDSEDGCWCHVSRVEVGVGRLVITVSILHLQCCSTSGLELGFEVLGLDAQFKHSQRFGMAA